MGCPVELQILTSVLIQERHRETGNRGDGGHVTKTARDWRRQPRSPRGQQRLGESKNGFSLDAPEGVECYQTQNPFLEQPQAIKQIKGRKHVSLAL